MVKHLQFKSWLLMMLLLIGSGSAWADESTLTFTKACGGSGTANDGVKWTVASDGTESNFDNTKGIHYGTNSGQVEYITLTTSGISGTVTKVVVNASTASGVTATASVTVGGTAFGGDAQSLSTTATNYTFEGSASGEIVVTVAKPSKAAKALYVKSVVVTYNAASLSSIALGGEYPVEFHVGDAFSHEGMTVTATYEDETTKDVTSSATFSDCDMNNVGNQTVTVSYTEGKVTKTAQYNINVKAPATITSITLSGNYQTVFTEGDEFNHEGLTVTANYDDDTNSDVTDEAVFSTPDMATPGVQDVTVTYNNLQTTYQITVNAIPTHNVTFNVNGATTSTSYKEGAAIDFPDDPADINGMTFVGWYGSTYSNASVAPEFVTSATMGTADVTYYAVFAKKTAGDLKVVTDNLNQIFTGVSGSTYTSWSGKADNSGVVYAGQSAGSYSAIQLRSSNNNSGVITTTSGGKATKVAVKWNSNTKNGRTINIYGKNTAYTNTTDLYDSNKQGDLLGTIVCGTSTDLTINGDYEYIGVCSADGALYLDALSITWESGTAASFSGYCTTVAADTRQEAGISFAEDAITKEIVVGYTGQVLSNPNNVAPITWTSSNENVATVEDGTVSVKAVGETTITAAFAGNKDYREASVSYTLTIQDSRVAIEPAFAEEEVTVNVTETVAAPALSGNTGNATVTYESDNTAVATVDENGQVTGVADGTATITATIAATNEYQGGTATFTVTVVDPNKPGTQGRPYTVAEAIAAIDAGTGVTGVYATGIVSKIVTEYSSQFGNISYNISADGTTNGDQLEAYRGKSYNGEDFTSADDIQVGDVVVIYGNLTKYGNTYEFGANNQLVSLERVVPTYPLDVTEGDHGTVAVTVDGKAWDGQTEIAQGATVELTATPAEGWAFTSWTVVGVELEDATANPVSFTMAGEVMIEATYADATTSYDVVVVDVDVDGGVITSDKESAKAGEKVVISYELEKGYAFGEWVVKDGDGNPVSVSYENEEYSFTMPANDVQISATYKKIHTVLYSVAGVDGEAERIDGDALNLDVPEAVNGMAFAGWSTTGDLNAPEFVANDAAVTDDMILYAMFTAKSGSTYQLVEANQENWTGDYLIAYDNATFANGKIGGTDGLGKVSTHVDPETALSGNTVDAEWGDKYNVTFVAVDAADLSKGYLMMTKDGKYNYQTSNSNGLAASANMATAVNYPLSITFKSSDDIEISIAAGAIFHYNTNGYFRFYRDGSMEAIKLYKKVAGESVYTLAVPVEASISAAKYATFHSDKNVYFSTSDVEVYTAHYNGSYVELTEVADGLVPANTAVVLHKDVDEKTTVEAYEVGDVEELTNNGLKISDGATAVGNGIYVLSNKSHGVGFYHWASDQSLSVGKVYIEIPAAGEAREFIGMVAGGSTTGISEVTSHAAQQSGVIYDLQGRKVETLKRGLYIINGKKAIIK